MLVAGSDTRIVELRVGDVSGTSGASLVDAVAAVDVAGDGVTRVVRPADRLLRPAPGPVLTAAGRSVPRTVEGYLWGGLTGPRWTRAAWALLLPFTLVNAARWMLPPLPADRAATRTLGLLLRALLRTVALLLSCLLAAQLVFVVLVVAPGPLWAVVAAGVAVLLHRLSGTGWAAPEPGPGSGVGAGPRSPGPGLPATPLTGSPDAPALRVLHTVAVLATGAFAGLGGPAGPAGGAAAPWVSSLLLLAAAVAGVVLLDDPTGATTDRGGRWLRTALARWPGHLLVTAGFLVLAAAAWWTSGAAVVASAAAPVSPGVAAAGLGAGATVGSVGVVIGVLVVVVGVLLVPAARLARPAWAALPADLRPWAGGWAAAPVLALAVLVGAGFGAGLTAVLTAARRIGLAAGVDGGVRLVWHGPPGVEAPFGYSALLAAWGVVGVLVPVGMLSIMIVLASRSWRLGRGLVDAPVEVPLLHPSPAERTVVAAAWWRAGLVRTRAHRVVFATVAVLVGALALAGTPYDWLEPVGVATLALLAAAVLRAEHRAGRRPDAPRSVAVLWDLAACWPREAHPAVPPCHPLRAVPELVRRAREHLADPSTRLVLCGHGHGGLLATVAAARLLADLPAHDRERVGLLTAGSPLRWAYPRAFPSVVPHSCLAELSGALGGRWRSLCRGTDPVGGGVTTWRRQAFEGSLLGVGLRDDGSEGPLPPATHGQDGALVLGGEHWLPDPARGPVHGRRWRAGVLGHRDYAADPEWDRAVALAAGLATDADLDADAFGRAMFGASAGRGGA